MNLSKVDLIALHRFIQKRYKTTPGIRQEGLLDSIIERPDLILFGKELYPDIYLKSASLMEGIIRLHPFIDGNKRTGLVATQAYLQINDYIPIFPVYAVRFSVIIAKTKAEVKEQEQEITDKLIRGISRWLRKYVVKNDDVKQFNKVISDINNEIKNLEKMFTYNPKKAERIMDEWLAIDIYPEYERNALELLKFIKTVNLRSSNSLRNKLKNKD